MAAGTFTTAIINISAANLLGVSTGHSIEPPYVWLRGQLLAFFLLQLAQARAARTGVGSSPPISIYGVGGDTIHVEVAVDLQSRELLQSEYCDSLAPLL